MRASFAVMVIISLILLGCVSSPIGGGQAPVITTSKNFTMREGGTDSFGLLEGSSTVTHTILMSKVEPDAALLKIDSQPLIMQWGQTRSVTLGGNTVVVTLNSIEEGYAMFTISLSQQSQQQPSGGGTQPGGGTQSNLKANGVQCASSSECQSNNCNNGYCCASGSCCISDSNCSVGRCNPTTYSCVTVTLLSNGNPCNSNSNCQSNYCNNGHCCNSGRCCLSSSDCTSGQVCNTSTASCVSSVAVYTAAEAEQLANSTADGALMGRFASIFNTAKQCSAASSANLQCIPSIVITDEQLSQSSFQVTYSYSFSGASCCPNSNVLTMTVDLSSDSTTSNWNAEMFASNSVASSAADAMNASLNTGCVAALQTIACRSS